MDNSQLAIAWDKPLSNFYKQLLVKPRGFYSVHSQLKAKAKGKK